MALSRSAASATAPKRTIFKGQTRKASRVMHTTKRLRKPLPARIAHLDRLLDEALKVTFPASDPVAITVDLEFSRRGTVAVVEPRMPRGRLRSRSRPVK